MDQCLATHTIRRQLPNANLIRLPCSSCCWRTCEIPQTRPDLVNEAMIGFENQAPAASVSGSQQSRSVDRRQRSSRCLFEGAFAPLVPPPPFRQTHTHTHTRARARRTVEPPLGVLTIRLVRHNGSPQQLRQTGTSKHLHAVVDTDFLY